jgi:hypothetical protein
LLFSGLYSIPDVEFVLCDCTDLRSRNLELEKALAAEKETRRKFESASHVYSYELGKALSRLSACEAKLKLVRNSFQFLRAGFDGFSTDLNIAIDSVGSNNDSFL